MLFGQLVKFPGKKQAGTRRLHRRRRVNDNDVEFFVGAFQKTAAIVSDDMSVGVLTARAASA